MVLRKQRDDNSAVIRILLSVQVRDDFGLEQINELRLHVLEIVGNMETDHPLVRNFLGKFFTKTPYVLFLHDKNEICPTNQPGGDAHTGARFGAGRAGHIIIHSIEDFLSSRTAPAITTAKEQELSRLRHPVLFQFLDEHLRVATALVVFLAARGWKVIRCAFSKTALGLKICEGLR